MRPGPITLCGTIVFVLAGCTGGPVKPSPTADQVLAVQYRAAGSLGAMSGSESDAIVNSYRENIAKPALASSTLASGSVTNK